jgi:hypothetical protein
MDANCKRLVASYFEWLRQRVSVKDINGVCEITTPFLDRNNDRLQIYVRKVGEGLLLTDDGYIIGDLESSGCPIDNPHRRQTLQSILNGYGVREEGGELLIEADVETFPRKKHALLQAMMTVNDRFVTIRHNSSSLFTEEVQRFLDEHEVPFVPKVDFHGKSGFTHNFDFVIPRRKKTPERLVKAINHPSRGTATQLLFAWTDTKDVRPEESSVLAILNDSEKALPPDVINAFEHYDVKTMLWSTREQHVNELQVA